MINNNIIDYLCKSSKYDSKELSYHLKRLEEIEKIANSNLYNGIIHLKNIYYRKYLIKHENVPVEYIGDDIWGKDIEDDISYIMDSQKCSLDMWLDYLLCTDVSYPQWFKFFVFQGIVKIGAYDEIRGKYNKRTKSTIAPFIDIDYEVLAFLYNNMCSFFRGEKLDDVNLEKIMKDANFSKLYNYCLEKVELKYLASDEDFKKVLLIDQKLKQLYKKSQEIEEKLRELNLGFERNKFSQLKELRDNVLKEIYELKDVKFWLVSLVKFNENIELRKSLNNKYNYYIYKRNTRICVGEINYRKFRVSGNIGDVGYSINKEFQGNGYAYQALELLGEKLYEDNIPNFVISVYDYNIASKKIIEKYGGILQEKDDDILIYNCDTKLCNRVFERNK